MALSIEPVDTPTAPESVLLEMHEHYLVHDAERNPGDPPMSWEQRLSGWRHVLDHLEIHRWVARDDGEIVAVAVLAMDTSSDPNNAFARVHVRPERRREGIGTLLMGPILDVVEADDRGSLITDTVDGAPWEPKLERLGMKKAFQAQTSRLLVEDIDWDLMDRWIERATERADGYGLKYVTFPIAEEDLQKWCDVMLLMNTAPSEDLEYEDFTMTPQKWRDIEAKDLARGRRLTAYVAVHQTSGDWVGLTEITYLDNQPEQAEQGDTAVDPAHRNKGLGRWLKASMIKRFIEEHPDVRSIDTGNAGSNEPMLNINYEMGYEPLRQECAWQGDVAVIRERLGV